MGRYSIFSAADSPKTSSVMVFHLNPLNMVLDDWVGT